MLDPRGSATEGVEGLTIKSTFLNAFIKSSTIKMRTLIVEDFIKAFKKVDLIVSPSTPSVALPLGSSINHPMFGEMADALMEPSSIAGLPSMNVPCGLTKKGLPIGFQFVGPQFSEKLLLNVAHKFEQTHERRVCEI